jgi:hypothetical protein
LERLIGTKAWDKLRPWQQQLLRVLLILTLVGLIPAVLGIIGLVVLTPLGLPWLDIIVDITIAVAMVLLLVGGGALGITARVLAGLMQ